MAKLRLTKSELKKEKESLKRYNRYLPTLILKKQQLQAEINKIKHELEEEEKRGEQFLQEIEKWIDVFGEQIDISNTLSVEEIVTEEGNIAGIDIPVFKKIIFKEEKYNLELTPLWVEDGLEAIKFIVEHTAKKDILSKQLDLVAEELRTTTQRVNLFEKVKIPETKENIKKIQIFLGDLQTAAVVTGKIAKEKIQKKAQARVEV